MKKKIFFRLATALMLLVFTASTQAATQTIQKLHDLLTQSIKSGDIEAALKLYEPDAIFIPASGAPVKGRKAIAAQLASFTHADQAIETLATQIWENGNIILVRSQWRYGSQTGTAIEVWRKDPKLGWRYVIDNPYGR